MLLNKFTSLLGRGRPARPPVSDHHAEADSSTRDAASAMASRRDEASGLTNSLVRGGAEGTAREAVREVLRQIKQALGD